MSYARVLVSLIRAEGIERLDPKRPYNPAEGVRLLIVEVDKLRGTFFNE